MSWIFVALVVVADWLVINKNRNGFYIWLIVDGFFAVTNFFSSNYAESTTFFLYAIMGIYGLIHWEK